MSKREKQTLVSIFTGGGGLDIGLEQAGFETVAAVDLDENCCETLARNQIARIRIPGSRRDYLQNTKIIQASVEGLAAADLKPVGAASSWRPDLLAGGPPCQPFSSAGKQLALRDPRGRLFTEFVRLASELRPRMILFENVRGLVTARGARDVPGEVLLMVKRSFEEIGYATSFALLNSADYGAPQRRVRLFMLGSRGGPLPEFPPATHCEDPRPDLFSRSLAPWSQLGDFLKSARIPVAPEEIVRPSAKLKTLLEGLRDGSGLRSAGTREATRPGGHWGYKQGTFIADRSKPARTVTAASTQDWIRDEVGLRRLTWRECAGIQGFPREWEFIGDRTSKYRQIGNAVPVIFGDVLGRAIIDGLSNQSRGRAESAPLPIGLVEAIRYTKREDQRNGESRRRARLAKQTGRTTAELKGLGRLAG